MAVERRNVIVHILPFAFKVIGDGVAQALMGDVVRRMRAFWRISARQFVCALRARFNAVQTAFDSEINRLIIANLKMQKRMVFNAPQLRPNSVLPPIKFSAPAI